MKSPTETIPTRTASDFDLANPLLEPTRFVAQSAEEPRDFDLLPRSYGIPVVVALARNPTSLFVYWEIDWPAFFERTAPRNRQVHLRLQKSDGMEISSMPIEPMAGHCEVSVPNSNTSYRVELGYFDADQAWHSVGKADVVNTPASRLDEHVEATFATVPYHLSFQHLVDQLRASSGAGDSVIEQLARLQEKALIGEGSSSLTSAEEEILRAMEADLPERWRDAARNPGGAINLERRLEDILGFGSGSPSGALGGSSRI